MNIVLKISDNIDELKQNHKLSLWSKVQSYETVFIISVGSVSVGYIIYNSHNNVITKFEVVESYRNSGIGSIALQKFLKKIKPYSNKVIVYPISESLFGYYERFGFSRKLINKNKMICVI